MFFHQTDVCVNKTEVFQQDIIVLQTFDAFPCVAIDRNFRPCSTIQVAEVIMMRLDH